jgi:hypothetical protein
MRLAAGLIIAVLACSSSPTETDSTPSLVKDHQPCAYYDDGTNSCQAADVAVSSGTAVDYEPTGGEQEEVCGGGYCTGDGLISKCYVVTYPNGDRVHQCYKPEP